jgi:hypothetical protein
MLRSTGGQQDRVKRRRAMQACNPLRDSPVGLIEPMGSAGECKPVSRCLLYLTFIPQEEKRDIGR